MRSANFGLKLGLGIGGGVFAVVAIVVALFAAFFVFANSITEKVEATAEEFVGAVAEDDWDTAYAMLCEDARQRPVEDYVAEWDAWDAEGAEIGAIDAATGNVTVEFDDGSAVELVIAVEQTQETLDTSVCGWSEVPAQ
jgi:glucose dehydrogenase